MLRGLKEFSLPRLEEKILELWRENKTFQKTILARAKRKKFIFYEGPPTANGRPGIHHVLVRTFKDVIPRYKTMAGFSVPRKGGWDTHGLPVELEVEKQLGLKSKKDIEKYGIAAFNRKCKESVWKYKNEWERLTERIGFWLDLENPYVTYENSYIESLWHILKQAWNAKLLYRGHKVVPWCTRCGTILSSHELALGYKEVTENSVYIKFELEKGQTIGTLKAPANTYILAWTTTPWTLPGNVALAVGEKIDYVLAQNPNAPHETLIVAKERAETFGITTISTRTVKGKALLGLSYKPLFKVKPLATESAYKVYDAHFVTTTDGTGVVHTAVMYGEDDYVLGVSKNLPEYHTVNEEGMFTDAVEGLSGLPIKADDTNKQILNHLKKHNLLFKQEPYAHEYPFCWRCSTPLIYYARASWFIKMSALRKELESSNQKIHWIPEHLKNGRFGEWLRGAKDWAISRERYWGTPLPLWQCDRCHRTHVIGSIEELSSCFQNSHNRYFFARHGEAESNILGKVSGWPEKTKHHLTLKGNAQIERLASSLRKQKIDLIISSDITRTKETAEIIANVLGKKSVIFDERLREINTGDFNGCHDASYHSFYQSDIEKFEKKPPNGESLTDLRARVFSVIAELEEKYSGKAILIITHEYPIWMAESALRGWSNEEAVHEKHIRGDDFIGTGEIREISLLRIPRDENGLADLHRPYIDAVVWKCSKCKGIMRRVDEVLDVWFDSGAMPFAQAHWPFENKNELAFPADYIVEAIDQTRGWFYTLLAISTFLGKKAPYKNVISLGLILDSKGQKMSKSKGNAIDPWEMIERYGADAIRWYFLTVNPPGESKLFNETDIGKSFRQSLMLAYNSFVFFSTYAHVSAGAKTRQSKNILDQWIQARTNETVQNVTKFLDNYEIGEAARVVERYIGDLSRWYIRRSRRRFQKPTNVADYRDASQTLFTALRTLAVLLAPFTPFFAEALYLSLISKKGGSVHLEAWPLSKAKKSATLLVHMEEIRRLASIGLAKRAEAGIKVRQPLSELRVKKLPRGISKKLITVLSDEINVKRVVGKKNIKEECELNTTITHELREEGLLREFMRLVQELRQDANLIPKDSITISIEGSDEFMHVVQTREKIIQRETKARAIIYRRLEKHIAVRETVIDGQPLRVAIQKR